jgi:hypothetical protein
MDAPWAEDNEKRSALDRLKRLKMERMDIASATAVNQGS